MTDGLDLFHVPPADFKIRCATHLFAFPVRRALLHFRQHPRRGRWWYRALFARGVVVLCEVGPQIACACYVSGNIDALSATTGGDGWARFQGRRGLFWSRVSST
jgi:hypothetical protein